MNKSTYRTVKTIFEVNVEETADLLLQLKVLFNFVIVIIDTYTYVLKYKYFWI